MTVPQVVELSGIIFEEVVLTRVLDIPRIRHGLTILSLQPD
jgi:hypothetical protein